MFPNDEGLGADCCCCVVPNGEGLGADCCCGAANGFIAVLCPPEETNGEGAGAAEVVAAPKGLCVRVLAVVVALEPKGERLLLIPCLAPTDAETFAP